MLVKPARCIEKFLPLFESKKSKVVLDYGSGNLRNSIYLHRKGYSVYAVDLPHRTQIKSIPSLSCILPEEVANLEQNIDVTLCTFVLNLIPAAERNMFIKLIAEKMSHGGFFLIETKGFTLTQLDTMVIPKGFLRIYNDKGRYTVIALYKKVGLLN